MLAGLAFRRACPLNVTDDIHVEEPGCFSVNRHEQEPICTDNLPDLLKKSGIADIYGPLGKIPGIPAIHEARVTGKLFKTVQRLVSEMPPPDYFSHVKPVTFADQSGTKEPSSSDVVYFSGEILPEGAEV